MLELETTFLRDLLNRASKGAGKDKLITPTEVVNIKVANNEIRLFTTDFNTDLEIVKPFEYDGEFSAVVKLTAFQKLIDKTTTKTVKLSVDKEKNVLCVEGNGSYEFSIFLEGGREVEYPSIVIPNVEPKILPTETLKEVLQNNSGCVSKDLSSGIQYTGYYFYPNGVETANRVTGCRTVTDLDIGTLMLPTQTMNLLSGVTSEQTEWYVTEEDVVIKSEDMTVRSPKLEFAVIGRFPHVNLESILNREFDNTVVVNKNEIINAVDRLIVLKRGEYGLGTPIRVVFDCDLISLMALNATGIEIIYCEPDSNRMTVELLLDGEMLKSVLQDFRGETVKIKYNGDISEDDNTKSTSVIVFEDGKSCKFIARMVQPKVQQG